MTFCDTHKSFFSNVVATLLEDKKKKHFFTKYEIVGV